jgi:hypothetical protein
MEGVAISLHSMEEANRKLDLLLQILRPAQASFTISAEHMAAILAELLRVGEWMRAGLAHNAEGKLAEELERYRHHLEDLRHLLPSLHAQLLTERSRLQAERAHLEATAAWARSARGHST